MIKSATILLLAAAAFAQMDDGISESHFNNVGIAVRLMDRDSVLVTIGAGSEDLQNTVGVFPYGDSDVVKFRRFEQKIETYLQDRVPLTVDGRRIPLRVVQWKPGGAGREDVLDMSSLYVQNLYITLGGRLPAKRARLEINANLWVERSDAAETVVQYSFFEGDKALRRLWTRRERPVRFPLAADSLAAMRANPPPPLRRSVPEEIGDPGDPSDHEH